MGRRVRFNVWHRGESNDWGPKDRSKFTGEVIEVTKDFWEKPVFVVKRDYDGKTQYCHMTGLIEYVN